MPNEQTVRDVSMLGDPGCPVGVLVLAGDGDVPVAVVRDVAGVLDTPRLRYAGPFRKTIGDRPPALTEPALGIAPCQTPNLVISG